MSGHVRLATTGTTIASAIDVTAAALKQVCLTFSSRQHNCDLLYNLLEACAVNMAEFNASSQITSCFENECLSSALFLKTGTVTQPCSLGRHIPYPTPTLLPLHSRDKVLEICQAASAVRKFKLCKYHAHILLVLHVIELNRK